MSAIPGAFRSDGVLPPGDYQASFDDIRQSILVMGPDSNASPNWDHAWRGALVDNLEVLTRQLWAAGVVNIFADGSFVEDKDHPNDIDGYFECDIQALASGVLTRDLNLLDPYKIWTWDPRSRRPYKGYAKKQLPMWHQYRVELYPHFPGMGCGIFDQNGHEFEFPAAFRQTRGSGQAKGIIKIQQGVAS